MSEKSIIDKWKRNPWKPINDENFQEIKDLEEPKFFRKNMFDIMSDNTFERKFLGVNVFSTGGTIYLPTGSTFLPETNTFVADFYRIESSPKPNEPSINVDRYWIVSGSISPIDVPKEKHWITSGSCEPEIFKAFAEKIKIQTLKTGSDKEEN